ncbi:MAG: type II toxin-antitoxin system PemK/MazF family toxin [Verrucomicrobia bacterium]|nr:type II toxin-antitoxin system PemK/MazF family toxin [Verrucomicrobiota bacterium]
MGKPVVGDIVVLPFPQTDLQPGKRRPALVVADLAGSDLILCQVTRQARSDGYSIPLTAVDFQSGRLAVDSFIRPNRLFTVEQSVVIYTAAKVKDAKLAEVRTKIRELFA